METAAIFPGLCNSSHNVCAAQVKDGGIDPNGYYETIRQKFDKKHPYVNKVLTWRAFGVFSVLLGLTMHTAVWDFVENAPQRPQGIIVAANYYPNTIGKIFLENDEESQVWFGNPKIVLDQRCEILYAPRSKIAICIDPIEH